MNVQPDLVALRLPLRGVCLIEASAGTGKTFTLTAWVLRLLLEAGVPLPALLAVTFTRAATAELRERIRRRLRGAERLLQGEAGWDDESRQTEVLLAHARAAGIDDEKLRLRLQAALLQLDEAAVFTIHGFCQRALREFGFLAGALGEDEVVDDAREAWSEVAADLWRAHATHAVPGFTHLLRLWSEPEALASSLPALCDPARALLPEPAASDIAAWLHELRAQATQRFDASLAQRRQRTQDELIARVWQATTRQPGFAAALAARWPVLLVDEFQDTDPRQWQIFRAMHEAGGGESLLGLIGDPKQAIYAFRGGDLPTYLDARDYARAKGGEESLAINFRSRPAVLAAIETLFAQNALPFVEDGIAFHPLRAARVGQEHALRLDGTPPPGLTVHWLPPPEDPAKTRRGKDDDIASAIATTVAEIARLLDRGLLRDRHGERAVRAGDIAVLVRSNRQAALMRDALSAAGIAAATQGNDSVFASAAAHELHCLLEACAHPGDAARLHAALATRLLGFAAARIAELEDGSAALLRAQQQFEDAGQRWGQRGPLPALLPFFSAASQARLQEAGGARLLTDALHLAELLQARAPHEHGVHGLLRWFARQRREARGGEEAALRLDADAHAVQVVTLHKSKGLEYPVVFLPFTAFAGGGGANRGTRSVRLHQAGAPATYFFNGKGSGRQRELLLGDAARHDEFVQREARAELAEELRLFYVGVTRAQFALHLVWGHSHDSNDSALQWLLHAGEKAGRKNDALQPAGMRARIEAIAAGSNGSIVVQAMALPDARPPPPRRRDDEDAQTPPARSAQRTLRNVPGQYSFSGLRGKHAELPARGADDEAAAPTPVEAEPTAKLAGADFGNAVHDVLEAADFAAWRAAGNVPESQRKHVLDALKHYSLPQHESAQRQVGELVARALNVPLPGIATLAELAPAQRVAEMEFHFRLGATRLPQLYRLLETHGYPRHAAPLREDAIEGLMHGYIDLLYRGDDGAFRVLDYKTNQLREYSPAACRAAIADNDYDLQYLIYLVAVQRWLKLRLRGGYDAREHLGGAVYLFLRGLAPGDGASGIHVDRPPQALIDALDALFDGDAK